MSTNCHSLSFQRCLCLSYKYTNSFPLPLGHHGIVLRSFILAVFVLGQGTTICNLPAQNEDVIFQTCYWRFLDGIVNHRLYRPLSNQLCESSRFHRLGVFFYTSPPAINPSVGNTRPFLNTNWQHPILTLRNRRGLVL